MSTLSGFSLGAQGVFGTEARFQQNPETSDITASSDLEPKFSGIVEINTPDVDPSAGLVALPTQLVDASGLIATSCAAIGENQFIVTGRGGLPPNPNEMLSSDTVWSDLRSPTQFARTRSSSKEATNPTSSYPVPIIEAQGWVINDKCSVVLTASAPKATPHNPWMSPATCHAPPNPS